MSQPLHLHNLQIIDSQLDLAKKRIEEIEIALKDEVELNEAEKKNGADLLAKEQAQKDLKRAEEEVAAQQLKIDSNQKTLYSGSVSNTKELEDLQNEAAALGRYLNTLEERQIEMMIEFEDAETNLSQSLEVLEQVKTKLIQTRSLLAGEKSTLVSKIDNLEADRLKALENVEPDNLRMYSKLREKKRGRAVAEVKDNICTACGSTLTASQAQEARSPTIITCCNSCDRVLYSN